MSVQWEDPSSAGVRRQYDWLELLQPLTEQPERWARIAEMNGRGAGTVASQLRRRQRPMPPGRWEFTSRQEGAHSVVYARYLGPDEEATP